MIRVLNFIILTFGISIIGFAQSLSDSVFVLGFDSVEIDLNNVSPAGKYSEWLLVAGYCESIDKGYDKLNKQKIKDSLWIIRQDNINNLGNLLDLCVNKCNKKYSGQIDLFKQCSNYCDSIYELEYYLTKETYMKTAHKLLFDSKYVFSEQYRFGKKSKKTDNLLKSYDFCNTKGFGTWCPPNGCNWFLISIHKRDLIVVDTFDDLRKFIGVIDNPADAFLILLASELAPSNGYPRMKSKILYRKVDDDFYFITNIGLSDCPMETYKCLVKVSEGKKAEIVDKILIDRNDLCI